MFGKNRQPPSDLKIVGATTGSASDYAQSAAVLDVENAGGVGIVSGEEV